MSGETFWVRDPTKKEVVQVSRDAYNAFMKVRANKGSEQELVQAIGNPSEVLQFKAA